MANETSIGNSKKQFVTKAISGTTCILLLHCSQAQRKILHL